MQFRHEYKHTINHGDYLVIKSRLQAVMACDPHAGENGVYQIRSLYFDNMRDKALLEKNNGYSEREKFRLRCYNFSYDFIRLEKKVKKGGLGYKLSAPLSYAEAKSLLAGDCGWMQKSSSPLAAELYEKMKIQGLRPKTLVDYVREPFIYSAGNVRITLDYDIRTGGYSTNFLNPEIPMVPASPGTYILEVKYDDYLPDMIRDIIQLKYREENAFSKYGICRSFG